MKLAIVHDDLIQWGGAERLVLAASEIWKDAPIYTSIFNPNNLPEEFRKKNIVTSWMQKLPFKNSLFKVYFPFYPMAFESLDLSEFDVVLSSSTRFAHGVITKPGTLHICYCHTPPRMFWDSGAYFANEKLWSIKKLFLLPSISYLRIWDSAASERVDLWLANSNNVADKIKKVYRKEPFVIHPFVDIDRFTEENSGEGDYYLVVARLVSYKRVDLAIEACNELKLNLVIIGDGPDRDRLQKMAGKTVKFVGRLEDGEVVKYYYGCRALIFPGEEDLGITSLEAQAAGKPVIGYRGGGVQETVIEKITGEFFYPQTKEALISVLANFDTSYYKKNAILENAKRFSKERFKENLKQYVEGSYKRFREEKGRW